MATPTPQDNIDNQTVNVQDLETVPEPTLPPEQPPAETPEDVVGAAAAATAQSQTALEKEIARQTESINQQTADTTELSNMLRSELDPNAKSQERRLQEEQDRLGVIEGYRKLQDINNQISQATAAYNAGIVQEGGRVAPRQFVAGQQAQLRLQQAAEIGALTAAAQAQQGNIALAEQIAARTVNAEFADREQRISTLQSIIELNYQDLTAAEKRRADLVLEQTKREENDIAQQKEERNAVFSLMQEVSRNGAPADIVTKMSRAKTQEEALSIGIDYMQEPDEPISKKDLLDIQIKELEIQKLKKQQTGEEMTEEDRKLLFDLRQEAAKDPDIKEFVAIRDAYDRVEASAKDPSPAGDLALIFNYMKILDPGSTVREGEFANAQNAGSVSERVRAQYNKVVNGKTLSDEQRTDFVERAEQLYQPKLANYEQAVDFYQNEASNFGLPEDRVVRDYLTPSLDKTMREDYSGIGFDIDYDEALDLYGEEGLQKIIDTAKNVNPFSEESAYVPPEANPLSLGAVTGYGSPYWRWGLDIDLQKGDSVVSPVSGRVVFAGTNGGFGNQVRIETADGSSVWLSHLDGIDVQEGQQITAGTSVGLGGNSGAVIPQGGGDGSHLDLTVLKPDGSYMDPKEIYNKLSYTA